jgi:hypothetical protein
MFDPSDDFAGVIDGLVAVTVLRQGSTASAAVAHALRQSTRIRAGEGSAVPEAGADAVWHLPVGELADPPQPGDAVLDAAGRRWTVLSVRRTGLAGRWRCLARDLAAAYGLDAYVDVEKATYTRGPDGADVPTWNPWRTGLAARIRPLEAVITDEHQRHRAAARFSVLVAGGLEVDHTHRVKGPDGAIYTVLACRHPLPARALTEIEVAKAS